MLLLKANNIVAKTVYASLAIQIITTVISLAGVFLYILDIS